MDAVRANLKQLKERGRYRTLKNASGIDLSSNDYLGLSSHPALRAHALEAIERGVALGSGGSRLLRGNAPEHEALEEFAASYFGSEKALFFANGFAANYALLSTLPTRHDTIIYDALVHASMREGIRASHARSLKVAHNDVSAYEHALQVVRNKNRSVGIWIAVESLYSMDGDIAPLKELYALAQKYDATLIVDEAHATGVWGQSGKGLSEELITSQDHNKNLITIHTCGKALGVAGGLICAPADIIYTLINKARPFIFSTAPPPMQAILVQKALEISDSEEGDALRGKLYSICEHMKFILEGQCLDLLGQESQNIATQIIPIILGEDTRAVKIAQTLQDNGYDIRAIRPPTVPEGTARLRLSLNAGLDEECLQKFANHLMSCMKDKGSMAV